MLNLYPVQVMQRSRRRLRNAAFTNGELRPELEVRSSEALLHPRIVPILQGKKTRIGWYSRILIENHETEGKTVSSKSAILYHLLTHSLCHGIQSWYELMLVDG